VSPNGF